MTRIAILAGLGDYYRTSRTKYAALPFVYKNVVDLMDNLTIAGWKVPPPLINERATRENIIAQLAAAESKTGEGDTVLFYFTGHGDRIFNKATNKIDHYLVSAIEQNGAANFEINEFLNEINYGTFINRFDGKRKHLITIIDCCFAFGLIEGYQFQQQFHTVIAASSENSQAFYNSNSLFFHAFKKSWHTGNFRNLKNSIESEMYALGSPSLCKIAVSPTYETQSLL